MGFQIDLDEIRPPVHLDRRTPGPVRRLNGREEPGGDLKLWWLRPAGGAWIDGYRIERTREGRNYELLSVTDELQHTVATPERGEPWFYRVTAFNGRGIGRARLVFLHRPAVRLRPRGRILPCKTLLIPVIPGVRVNISEDWPTLPRRNPKPPPRIST